MAVARSALYPSLSLSGGYGTGVYSADKDKFWAQVRHNSREYVGLSLNVPIFNRRAARNDIRTAQIAVRSQRLAVTEAERELRKLIEQAWYNADASYAKYRVRLQRRQNAHGEGRSRGRAGQIRIRIPFENTRFLPRETADALKKPARNKQFETNRATRKGRPIAIRNISPNKIPDGFR